MAKKNETKEQEFARLTEELAELKATLPAHCYGSKGYTGIHHATPRHWELIEETEERIKQLKGELGL